MPPIMCGKIFEAVKTDVEKRRNLFRHLQAESTSSTTSSMSGYGNNNNTNGVQGTPYSMPWTVVPPVQWSNPPLLSCMAPNNEAPSSSSSSFSGFHGGPLQFPYDRLLQSSVYGRKSGVVLHDHHDSSPMLLSNGPSGMLMDGYGHGGLNLTGEMSNVKMTPQEIIDAKALAASKSHSEAERRRRERINTHLATLRTMLPSTTKTDKASLLAEVIDHVKDLKRQAAEIAEGSAVPTEADEVTVDSDPENKSLIKASVCCDDRPDLLSDLIKALATLNLRTLKAEITTLGGRVNNVLLLDQQNHQNHHYQHDNNNNPAPPPPSLTCIQDALKAVMERPNSEDSPPGNKRQRLNPFNSIHILDHRSI